MQVNAFEMEGNMAMNKQIIFNIGEGSYGIDVSKVMGIEKDIPVISIPNSPKCIKGIINLRGDVIPVYSLREKFGMPTDVQLDTKELVIAKSQGVVIAIEVDLVKEIVELEDSMLGAVPTILKDEGTEYIGSVAHVDKNLVLVLNLDGLLDKSQADHLQTIVENQ